jgi:hypothetical protein
MKNTKQEQLIYLQRQYHRSNQWRLTQAGLYLPHSYTETSPGDPSWWDDIGFVMNGRRVIVWWLHPCRIYADAIAAQSWREVGPGPQYDWLTEGCIKNYRQLGSSRKKIVSYTSPEPSEAQRLHYERLDEVRARLTKEGIDADVSVSWKLERLKWATSVTLIAPLEVRNEGEAASVARLARRLILGETTLDAEFPEYLYKQADWLRENEK